RPERVQRRDRATREGRALKENDMLEPLVKTIEVPCDQKKAFTVFLDMGSWWPKDRFATSVMRGQTVKALRVDAREGGRIVEVGTRARCAHPSGAPYGVNWTGQAPGSTASRDATAGTVSCPASASAS